MHCTINRKYLRYFERNPRNIVNICANIYGIFNGFERGLLYACTSLHSLAPPADLAAAGLATAALGKPHVRILGVQPEFCRKGGGGWIALPNGLWHFFSEYEPLLRNQICIIFHHYLPWFTSEYHLRIMFDHSYCQNVHSQSQNRCFKEFANFRRKIPATKRPFAWGGGVETLSGRMPFEHAFFLRGASLSIVIQEWRIFKAYLILMEK